MKVFAVMGSPRKEENTDILLDSCLHGIREAHPKAEIVKVYPQEMNIGFCVACNICTTPEAECCVIQDSMQQVYKDMSESDVWIFATPMYWWNMSAQLKVFVDRMHGLRKRPANLKTAVLVTYAGPDPTEGVDIISRAFSNSFDFMGCVKSYECIGAITGEVHVRDNEKVKKDAFELGKRLAT